MYTERQLSVPQPELVVKELKKLYPNCWSKNDTLQYNILTILKALRRHRLRIREMCISTISTESFYTIQFKSLSNHINKLRTKYEGRKLKFIELHSSHCKLRSELARYKKMYGDLPEKQQEQSRSGSLNWLQRLRLWKTPSKRA